MLFSWPPNTPPKARYLRPKQLSAALAISNQRNTIDSRKSWLDQRSLPEQTHANNPQDTLQHASEQLLRHSILSKPAFANKSIQKSKQRGLQSQARITAYQQKNSQQPKGSQLNLLV